MILKFVYTLSRKIDINFAQPLSKLKIKFKSSLLLSLYLLNRRRIAKRKRVIILTPKIPSRNEKKIVQGVKY